MMRMVARGNLMRLHERWSEAAEDYSRALDLVGTPEREHWTVVYFRAIAYERAGEWDLAEPDFRAALELEPDHPSVLNYLGYSLVDMRRNLDEAMEMIARPSSCGPMTAISSTAWAGRITSSAITRRR
jgi:Flp pilus assembly protein TadD